ncbi:unnamed protein product [Meganyctiphanes norvegica]|uniref:C-type lectin domain-containing protein n=1 Tax=Meganyctiphanes norvegica TaxID=48144 RepID=A0AAV2RYW3_MEGNR
MFFISSSLMPNVLVIIVIMVIVTGHCTNGCDESDGFLQSPRGNCFKAILEDNTHNWASAQSRCAREHLFLAQPGDNNATWLQLTLLNKYYGRTQLYWINGYIVNPPLYQWGDGQVVAADHPLWYPGDKGDGFPKEPVTSSGRCMVIDAWQNHIQHHPGRPYRTYECAEVFPVPLCQV